jgi:hypothetical protein
MGFTYLATPYSSPDTELVEQRYLAAEKVAAELLQRGITIYSPIVHMHTISLKFSLPGDFDFWKRHNENMLMQADSLYALTLPGWRTSKGMAAEMHFARSREIPIMLLHPEEFECLLPSE